MFPLTLTNNVKFIPKSNNEVMSDQNVKEKLIQCISQCFPNKTGLKVNAIVVVEADNDVKRTICFNEAVANNQNNSGNNNIQITTSFPFSPTTTSNVTSNGTGLLISQPPIFPANLDDLQAFLQLATPTLMRLDNHCLPSSNSGATVQNSQPQTVKPVNSGTEKIVSPEAPESISRKRKAEKPCKIPQDYQTEFSNGLDLSVSFPKSESSNSLAETDTKLERFFNNPVWPYSGGMDLNSNSAASMLFPNSHNPIIKPRKQHTLTGHKKSSKIFNCNQCKLQFNSLTSLCKHTFSDHRAFRCTFCGANFTQRSNLQRHSLKHVGFKPFVCNVCEKAYYRKDHLVRHIEVSHPGCDPKCSITVKLTSSECLEYLEKMQTDKLNEMDTDEVGAGGGGGAVSAQLMDNNSIIKNIVAESLEEITSLMKSEPDLPMLPMLPLAVGPGNEDEDNYEEEQSPSNLANVSFDAQTSSVGEDDGDDSKSLQIDCSAHLLRPDSVQHPPSLSVISVPSFSPIDPDSSVPALTDAIKTENCISNNEHKSPKK